MHDLLTNMHDLLTNMHALLTNMHALLTNMQVCCAGKHSNKHECFNLAISMFACLCADPSDYIGGVFTVTFQPGEKAKTVTFTVVDDEYAECTEQLLASLAIPERSKVLGVVRGEPHMVTVDIGDSDSIICSVDESDSTVTVDEGVGAVNICVSCSGKSSNRFTLQVRTTNDTATGGSCDSHMTVVQSHAYHVTVTTHVRVV